MVFAFTCQLKSVIVAIVRLDVLRIILTLLVVGLQPLEIVPVVHTER